MKKFALLLCLAIPFTAICQIEKPMTKGNIMLSGGVFGEFSKDKSVSSFISATPGSLHVGYAEVLLIHSMAPLLKGVCANPKASPACTCNRTHLRGGYLKYSQHRHAVLQQTPGEQ